METKICSKCSEEKELIEFDKYKTGKDGIHSQCKKCKSSYYRMYYKKNRIRIQEQRQE